MPLVNLVVTLVVAGFVLKSVGLWDDLTGFRIGALRDCV